MSYENLQISRKGSRAVFFKRNMPKATADFDGKTVSLLMVPLIWHGRMPPENLKMQVLWA